MVILKEKEASSYLRRASATLRPSDHPFSNLALVSKMLEIEAAFIERVTENGPKELAQVIIDSSGFPELESWQKDVEKIFGFANSVRASRIDAIKPLIRQFGNASFLGVLEESKNAATRVSKEYDVLKSIERISKEQREFLLSRRNFFDGGFPSLSIFYTSDKLPGLLLAKNTCTPFQPTQKEGLINVPSIAGLKYVDLPPQQQSKQESDRTQFILYAFIKDDSNIDNELRVLTPNGGLFAAYAYDARRYCIAHEKVDCIDISCNFHRAYGDDFSEIMKIPDSSVPSLDCQTVIRFGEDMQTLHPLLMKLYLTLETAGLNYFELDAYLKAIPKFDDLIKKTTRFAEDTAGNKAFTDKEIIKNGQVIADSLRLAFESLPNEGLKASFQLVLAEVAQGLIQELQMPKTNTDLAIEPSQIVQASRRRKFLGLI